jgi:hypothetical protein
MMTVDIEFADNRRLSQYETSRGLICYAKGESSEGTHSSGKAYR